MTYILLNLHIIFSITEYSKHNTMNMNSRTFLFLADGFETVEAMATADVLIRGGINLKTISISKTLNIMSAQNISVAADMTLEEFDLGGISRDDIMIFPGGMPGSANLAACAPLMEAMKRHYAEGGKVAAICAAPALVLSLLPLEDVVRRNGSLKMTCYEGFEQHLTPKGVTIVDQREGTADDCGIITASGAGHAIAFGLKILENLAGRQAADDIAKSIML